MMKRIIALLLALILTVGLLPTVALAAEGTAGPIASVTGNDSSGNVHVKKEIYQNDDGTYKVRLESWATGTQTIVEKHLPMDIVLVLDVSGSMKTKDVVSSADTPTQVGENEKNESLRSKAAANNLFVQVDGNYYPVTVQRNPNRQGLNTEYTYSYTKDGSTVNLGTYKGSNRTYSNSNMPLYSVQSNNYITRLDALKNAVNAFIEKVATDATKNKVDHKISIVKFAGTELTNKNGDDMYWVGQDHRNNTQIVKELTSANVTSNVTALQAAVNALNYGGATQADFGMNRAAAALGSFTSEDVKTRGRIVIMFTDGVPTDYQDYDNGVAGNAVAKARELKDKGAKVYTIAMIGSANPSDTSRNINRYMNGVSSNYPQATKCDSGYYIDHWYHYGVDLGTRGDGSYYQAASSSADSLKKIFDAISKDISNNTTALDESAILFDELPENFEIPANAQNITTKTADYTGENTWGADTTVTNLRIKPKNNNTLFEITGFNYADNWCGKRTDNSYGGKKLIVEFNIQHDNYGGTQPTNKSAGISNEEEEDALVIVPNPSIAVPIAIPSITVPSATKVYDGTGIDVLENVAVEADKLVTGENEGKNAFVDIIVKVKDEAGEEYTYTIPAGETTGSWSPKNTEFKTLADVKIVSGAVSNYTYGMTITFEDATDNGAPKAIENATATYTITKRPVTLTSGSDEKKYDGTPLTKHEVTASTGEGVGFVGGDEATYTFTGSQTEAGESDNTFDYILNDGTVATNYEITKQVGKLKVTKDDTTKITVTITGKTETKEYNGQTQTVTGFDYTVTGADKNDVTVTLKEGATASASGKDVKTDNDGKYMMGLIASNFTVSSDKYSSVTIKEVEDGWIKITPAQVTLTSETASKDYDGAPLTKPDVTVGGSGQDVFKSEVTGITATGTVTDPGPAVDNTITYTPDTNFKESNYNISKSEGKLSINDIAAPTNLPTVNVYCTNTEVEHADSTGNALKNNTYTSVVSKNAENKYICTITLTDKNSYISDYDASTGATHTSDTTKTDFTKIILHYDTDAKAWPTPIVNFALNVKCDTPTVNVTYTWDGLDENDFDTVYPAPTKPDNATPNKGSDYTVDSRYDNSFIAIGKDGVRYTFSGWSTDATIDNGQIKSIQNDVTLTGHWTKVNAFDLNGKIYKSFTAKTGSNPIPEADDLTYNFEVTVEPLQNDKERSRYGSVELTAGTTDDVPFNFNNVRYLTFDAKGIYTFSVKETSSYTSGSTAVKGTITNDTTEYLLTIQVDETLNVVAYSFVEMPAGDTPTEVVPTGEPTITFENKYLDDPKADDVYLDLSKYVTKTFESRHGKSATESFEARVEIWVKNPEIIVIAAEENAIAVYDSDPVNGTVVYDGIGTVTLSTGEKASFTFATNPKLDRRYAYAIRVTEVAGNNTDVEYDKTVYESRFGFFNGTKEIQWLEGTSNFSFTNTYTGIDDYYPIIIPTIIGKDTGMLNKTDHFAYVIGYPDGTVHPNGQITRAEVATIFFRLLRDEVRDGAFTTSNSYSDVAYGKWYNNPISTMSALGIITGYPDGTFKPNKPITRAEFAAIAARFDETQSGKSATFSDVIGHWAAKEIGIAYYNDWIKGYPDGTFKPDQNITRAEAMTLINRVLERKPESPADLLTNMNKWTDNMDTSKWYYLDVQEATNSHGYTRKTFNYELWRQMLPDPDWSRYER